MVSAAYRGVIALAVAIAITSPAWGLRQENSTWLETVLQPSSGVVFLFAVLGVVVGLYVSRKRREP